MNYGQFVDKYDQRRVLHNVVPELRLNQHHFCSFNPALNVSRARNLGAEAVDEALGHQRDFEHIVGPVEVVLPVGLEQLC